MQTPVRGWPVLGRIVGLAAPLTGFFALQSAANLASTAMLGQLGNAALAGVGAAGALYGLILALLFGIDAAVQATVARATGAGRDDQLGAVLSDAWALALPLGALLAAACWIGAPTLVGALLPDPPAAAVGAEWLRAAAPSLAALALTIPINACWIGCGRPQYAFLVAAVMTPVQIGATWAFLFALPPHSAAGAGAALSVSALAGVGLQLALAVRFRLVGSGAARPPRLGGALAIGRLGWPISAQQAFNQLGLMVAFAIVARLGVAQAAAANVLVTLATVPIQLSVALGVAAATLVGQALGAGAVEEGRRWGWRVAGLGALASVLFGLLALTATRPMLGLFLKAPSALEIAVWPTRVVALGLTAEAVAQVLCFAFRGAGATRIGAAVPFAAQWLLRLPLSWAMAVGLKLGLLGFAAVNTGVGVGEAALTALIWACSSWTMRKISVAT